MALNDLWKKFIRDEDADMEDEGDYYRPRKKMTAPSLIDEPDDDAFRAPKTRTGASRMARANDYDDIMDDDAYTAPAAPRRCLSPLSAMVWHATTCLFTSGTATISPGPAACALCPRAQYWQTA